MALTHAAAICFTHLLDCKALPSLYGRKYGPIVRRSDEFLVDSAITFIVIFSRLPLNGVKDLLMIIFYTK